MPRAGLSDEQVEAIRALQAEYEGGGAQLDG